MKKPVFAFFAVGLALALPLSAQDYAFRVLASKGANEVKSAEGWQPLKTGGSLKSGDELKVAENSYVALVHVGGKPLELKNADTYKVADLAGSIGEGKNVVNKYADFILSKSAEDKKNLMKATGAVHRGTEEIDTYLPDNVHNHFLGGRVILSWTPPAAGGPYVVSLKNLFGDDLLTKETPETSIVLDLSDKKYLDEQAIQVEVGTKADPKMKWEERTIRRLQPEEQEPYRKALEELGDLKEETALNKFILAGFYEENKLFIDAATAYQDAIRLAPGVDTYREAYDNFLLANGLKNPPKQN
jgi:hypothetical protein